VGPEVGESSLHSRRYGVEGAPPVANTLVGCSMSAVRTSTSPRETHDTGPQSIKARIQLRISGISIRLEYRTLVHSPK
jgi:hypothetical protein